MKFKEPGEDGLIEQIRLMTETKGAKIAAGIGDDAAVVEKDNGSFTLAATDMLIENIHFTRGMSFFDIGHKAMAVNLSDIAAMGGSPEYALVSIGVTDDMSAADIKLLYEGLLSPAREYGLDIIGGDTNRSPECFIVNVCIIGAAGKKEICLRTGAKPGDSVFVTGTLGNSALALKRGEYFPVKPRIKESSALIAIAKPTAMIDISDGLAKDLKRLCRSSKTGAEIISEKIPAAEGASMQTAIGGGEDFELLFTAPAEEENKLLSEFPERTGVKLSAIGKINADREALFMVDKDGRRSALKGGYEHF